MAPEYHYQALNATRNEVRLFTFDNNKEGAQGIAGHLAIVSLDQLPGYIALSYCWGNQEKTIPIVLGNDVYPVTENLFHLLRQLQQSRNPPRLWIDAICINQRDTSEKATQINLMGSIYKRAQQVIAWVGEEDQYTSEAFGLLQEVASEPPQSELDELRSLSTRKLPVSAAKGLRSLINREYWRRVWILQEILLARDVEVRCGDQRISWDTMMVAFSRKVLERLLNQRVEGHRVGIKCLRDLSEQRDVELFEALQLSLTSRSSEARDKVFALLSLVSDSNDFLATTTYEDSLEDLNKNMTLTFLHSRGVLDIIPLLARGCHDRTVLDDEYPSWVPRWHDLSEKKHGEGLACLITPTMMIPSFYSPRRVPGGRKRDLPVKPKLQRHTLRRCLYDEGRLICASRPLGQIKILSASLNDEGPLTFQNAGSDIPNPYAASADQGSFSAGLAILDCFSTSLSMKLHMPDSHRYSTSVMLNEFQSLLGKSGNYTGLDAALKDWFEVHRSLPIHGRTIQQWANSLPWKASNLEVGACLALTKLHLRTDAKYKTRHAFRTLTFNVVKGHRLIVTEQGYVGWAPEHTRLGDSIHLLEGCETPIVLRPRERSGLVVVGKAAIAGEKVLNPRSRKDYDERIRELSGGLATEDVHLY